MAVRDSGFPSIGREIGDRVLEVVRGCTFDDFIFAPQRSVLVRRDPAAIDLSCRLSRRITLKRPIVSANMDTVTRAPMAIVQAEEGGIGIIDRGFRARRDRAAGARGRDRQAHAARRHQRSATASAPARRSTRRAALMARSRVGTLVVVDDDRRLLGLLTERDMRFVDGAGSRVSRSHDAARSARRPSRAALDLDDGRADHGRAQGQEAAARRRRRRAARADHGAGSRQAAAACRLRRATRHGRLMVGAAIGATGDYLERAAELVRAGVDVLVIDIAHGHSRGHGARDVASSASAFGDVEVIAGNVATAEGARFLIDRGADGVKVGIGPGGGCTTRMTTSFGVPQVQALVECRLAVGDAGVPIIADGGVKRHGALAEALLFGGDCAMLGSAFAGTEEAPGEVVHKSVLLPESQKTVKVPFKVLRGMASIDAIRDRLDVEDADTVELEAIGAEGHGDQRAGARLGARHRPRHDQAPLLVDQLRRRATASANCARCSGPRRTGT